MLARSARPDARFHVRASLTGVFQRPQPNPWGNRLPAPAVLGRTIRGDRWVGNPSVHSGVRPWNGRAHGEFLRGRHVRSTCHRSVRPAIHDPSRGSPRSSSTGEPSDPPFGALYTELDADRVAVVFFQRSGKTRPSTEGDASSLR